MDSLCKHTQDTLLRDVLGAGPAESALVAGADAATHDVRRVLGAGADAAAATSPDGALGSPGFLWCLFIITINIIISSSSSSSSSSILFGLNKHV